MAIVLLALSSLTIAAKPTSIAFISNGQNTSGINYSKYVVECPDGQKYPLTAWDHRKQWRIGSESRDNCHKK
jgi:hypothetical protein